MLYVDYNNLTPEPSMDGSNDEDDQPTFLDDSMDFAMMNEGGCVTTDVPTGWEK